jgi:glucosamine kinase
MNLIIEAGGTKSNLVYIDQGKTIASYTEPGLHLSRETEEDLGKKAIRWSEFHQGPIQSVFLFAAGKVAVAKEQRLKELLKNAFKADNVHIYSDLLAACYATAGSGPGIVGILGTGSNSCFYNGNEIEKQVSPGGFILGDEGSGTYLGKQILIHYLRDQVPGDIRQALEKEFGLSAELILQNIYGGNIKEAAAFCSSFAPFIISRLSHTYCMEICRQAVVAYLQLIEKNYLPYSNKLYLVGSVAFHLKDILQLEATERNIEIVKIIQHPIHDLSLFLSSRYQL